jgi:ribosomal protein L37AE/L43A
MTCPHCGNSDIRRSHSSQWSDVLHRAFGRDAYRCRKCRLRFYSPRYAQITTHATKKSDRSGKAAKRLDFRRRKRLIRRLITIAVFVVMFAMFGLFLRHIMEDHPPANNSQGADSSNQ